MAFIEIAELFFIRIKARYTFLGAEPEIPLLVLHYARHYIISQTFAGCVGSKPARGTVEQIHATAISAHPKVTVAIFINGKNKISTQTGGIIFDMGSEEHTSELQS